MKNLYALTNTEKSVIAGIIMLVGLGGIALFGGTCHSDRPTTAAPNSSTTSPNDKSDAPVPMPSKDDMYRACVSDNASYQYGKEIRGEECSEYQTNNDKGIFSWKDYTIFSNEEKCNACIDICFEKYQSYPSFTEQNKCEDICYKSPACKIIKVYSTQKDCVEKVCQDRYDICFKMEQGANGWDGKWSYCSMYFSPSQLAVIDAQTAITNKVNELKRASDKKKEEELEASYKKTFQDCWIAQKIDCQNNYQDCGFFSDCADDCERRGRVACLPVLNGITPTKSWYDFNKRSKEKF